MNNIINKLKEILHNADPYIICGSSKNSHYVKINFNDVGDAQEFHYELLQLLRNK